MDYYIPKKNSYFTNESAMICSYYLNLKSDIYMMSQEICFLQSYYLILICIFSFSIFMQLIC